jgi:hypothetical protein
LLGAFLAAGAGPRRTERPVGDRGAGGDAGGSRRGAAVLAWRHFDSSVGAPYETGSVGGALLNLAIAARWLALPGPLVDATPSRAVVALGGALLAAWAVWGVIAWRRGRRLVLASLAGSLLALAPVLPLKHHLAPYMAYLAVAGWALLLATLLPQRLPRPRAAIVAGLVACVAWGLFTTRTVLTRRNELGLPADDIVRATSLSWEARSVLRGVDGMGGGGPVRQIALLQVPAGPGALEHAQRYGERWAGRTDLHEALGRRPGPADDGARRCPGALAERAGHRARQRAGPGRDRHGPAPMGTHRPGGALRRPDRRGPRQFRARASAYPAGRRPWRPVDRIRLRRRPAADPAGAGDAAERAVHRLDGGALLATGASRIEIGGIQDIYFNLLCACTGRSVEELTRGSRVLLPGDPPAADAPRD